MAIYRELPNQNRLSGINTLAYMGTEATTPPQFVIEDRPPTPNDYQNFKIGTFWLERLTGLMWVLVAKTDIYGTGGMVGTPHYATWNSLSGEISWFITDDALPVYAAADGHVNILGGGGSNISTEGINPNTVNINVVRHPFFDALTITTFAAPAAQGILINAIDGLLQVSTGLDNQVMTMHGGVPIWVDIVSADGSVIITESVDPLHPGGINLQAKTVTLLKGDDGLVVTPDAVTGIVNVLSKDIIATARIAADTLEVGFSYSPDQLANEAYVPIGGGLAADTQWGYLTSSDLSVAITPGIDGGGTPYINLTAGAGAGTFAGLLDDALVTAVPNVAHKVKVAGDGIIQTSAAGSTLTVDISTSVGATTNGQLLIGGATGPKWAHLQVAGGLLLAEGDGTILLTQGGGGAGFVSSLKGDDAGNASPDLLGVINVIGGTVIETIGAAPVNTMTIRLQNSPDEGDILIGGGAVPGVDTKYGKLKSTTGTVTIAYGTEITGEPFLDLGSASFGGLIDNVGATAAPDAAHKVTLSADGLLYTVNSAPSTIEIGIDGTGVTDGMVLIGNTLTGVPEWNTIVGAGGINVVNANGTITIVGGGGGAFGIVTLDLDAGTANDPGTHIVRVEGGTNVAIDQSNPANAYTNIYTRSGANDLAEICLTDSIQLHTTNLAGTQGLFRIGTLDFMHGYGTHNCFFGGAGNRTLTVARAASNVGVGYQALHAIAGNPGLVTASYNTAVGVSCMEAMQNVSKQTAYGCYAMSAAADSAYSGYDVALGYEAMQNGAGGECVAVGSAALRAGGVYANAAANHVAIGINTLTACNNSIGNTCVGARNTIVATTASYNCIYGYNAASHLISGNNNCGFGPNVLDNITTGTDNLALGVGWVNGANIGAGSSLTAANAFNICLNNPGVAGDNFTTRIGDDVVGPASKCFIAGIRLQKAIANPKTVVIDSVTGQLGVGGAQIASGFSAYVPNDIADVTGDGTKYYLGMGNTDRAGVWHNSAPLTEDFDSGANFYPGDGINQACKFTAPSTGFYQINFMVLYSNLSTGVSPIYIEVYTAAGALRKTYEFISPPATNPAANPIDESAGISMAITMNATDYAKFAVSYTLATPHKWVGLRGASGLIIGRSIISGYLISV